MPSNREWVGNRLYARTDINRPPAATVVGPRIRSGGEGGVYHDQSRPEFALKLLHKPQSKTEAKIAAMLRSAPERQLQTDKSGDVVQIAWPQDLLYDEQSRFCGFSMRLLNKNLLVPLNAWFDVNARKRNQLSNSDNVRVYLAANLASVTEYIHRAGHAVVDFKPENVLAYRERGFVCLVDCDGFRIQNGSEVFPAGVATPAFVAPEFHADFRPATMDQQQDRFGLAVLIFKLLDSGRHPSSGTSARLPADEPNRIAQGAFFMAPNAPLIPPPDSHYPYFSKKTQALFLRAFAGDPKTRPTAHDWKLHLRELASNLQRCSRNQEHWHYGEGCPWCELKDQKGSDPTQMSVPEGTAIPPSPIQPKATPTPKPAAPSKPSSSHNTNPPFSPTRPASTSGVTPGFGTTSGGFSPFPSSQTAPAYVPPIATRTSKNWSGFLAVAKDYGPLVLGFGMSGLLSSKFTNAVIVPGGFAVPLLWKSRTRATWLKGVLAIGSFVAWWVAFHYGAQSHASLWGASLLGVVGLAIFVFAAIPRLPTVLEVGILLSASLMSSAITSAAGEAGSIPLFVSWQTMVGTALVWVTRRPNYRYGPSALFGNNLPLFSFRLGLLGLSLWWGFETVSTVSKAFALNDHPAGQSAPVETAPVKPAQPRLPTISKHSIPAPVTTPSGPPAFPNAALPLKRDEESTNVTTDTKSAKPSSLSDQKSQIMTALNHWQKTILANDPMQEASCYAPHVERYFRQEGVDNAFVLNYLNTMKQKNVEFRSFEISDPEIDLGNDGTASVAFLKSFSVRGADGEIRNVRARSELRLSLVDGLWKIFYERDHSV